MDKEKPAYRHENNDSNGWTSLIRSRVWPTVRGWFAPEYRKRYRAWIFQLYVLASLIAFTILTVFASVAEYFSFDLEFTRFVQTALPPWAGTLLYWVSWPGYTAGSLFSLGSTMLVLLLVGLRYEATLALATAGASMVVNNIIKFAIRRPRPGVDLVEVVQELTTFSFPSGHVMFYTAFFGFLAFLSYTLVKRRWLRRLMVLFFGLLVALVGLSRIYLGEHWASDVIGAYLLGFLILVAGIQVYRWGQKRQITDPAGEEDDAS